MIRFDRKAMFGLFGLSLSILSALSFGSGFIGLGVSLLLLGAAMLYVIVERNNPFHVLWFVGVAVFTVTPAIVFYVANYIIDYFLLSVLLALSYFVVFLSSGLPFPGDMVASRYKKWLIMLFLFALSLQIIASANTLKGSMYFAGLSSVVFVLLCRQSSPRAVACFYICYFFAFAIEYFFFWSGSGRLLLAANLVVPTIFAWHYSGRVVPVLGLSFLFSFAGLISSGNRYNISSLDSFLYAVLNDSMTSPVNLLGDIFYTDRVINWAGIIDQYLLFFIGALPRALWEGKPYGFGFQYTVDQMDWGLVEAGHSVASTFAGEHIYYLGAFWGIVSALFAVILFSIVYRIIYSLDRYKVLFSVYLMYVLTFYWGGLASFSHRFQLSFLLPFILLFVFLVVSKFFVVKRS